jgi:Fe-S-cluster containining protein
MKDGPVQKAVKRAAHGVFSTGLKLSRGNSSDSVFYELGGECCRSGMCCEAPAIHVGRLVWYAPFLRWLFIWWQRSVNGFVLEEKRRAEKVLVFRCTHFDRHTRLCDSYESRPGMCRDYPRALLYQSAPKLFPQCGYRVLAPNRRELLRALESQSIDDQKMDRLRKDLYLE